MENIREYITNLLLSTKRKGIDDLIEFLNNKSDFFVAPASRNFHGNFEGGLAIHSRFVYQILNKLASTFKREIEPDSIIIAALMHDFCKINFYKTVPKWFKDSEGKWQSKEGYDIDDQNPLGHGSKSIILLKDFITLKDYETYSILYHMGIPEDFELNKAFNKAVSKDSNIILLHIADFMASTIYEKKIE